MKKASTKIVNEQQELFRTDVSWFHIFKELIRSETWAGMSSNARSLYPVIKAHINWQDGNAFPSLDTLEKYSGLARASVTKALKELEALGLLKREAGHGRVKSNYRVVEKFDVTDAEGRPTAAVTFDYLPGMISDAVAEIKNFVATGKDDGKFQLIHIENLTLNVVQGDQYNIPGAHKQVLQGIKDRRDRKDSPEAKLVEALVDQPVPQSKKKS